jgi:hypothetical protein
MIETPVLFLIFNRPDLARQVFERIRQVKPKTLFIAADGPRHHEDILLCKQTREVVLQNIDWHCEIKTLLRDENLGCKVAVSSAITWFFENVDQGIILEDDCLPDISFFSFCRDLLKKYETDENIWHIGGNNFLLSEVGEGSYYLSKMPLSWGWATWKRAWKHFDADIQHYNLNDKNIFFSDEEIDNYWNNIFYAIKVKGTKNIWDFQWANALFLNKKFSLVPQYNLVRNIGFGVESLHTKDSFDICANLKTHNLSAIKHPSVLKYYPWADINLHRILGLYTPSYTKNLSGKAVAKLLANRLGQRLTKRSFFKI